MKTSIASDKIAFFLKFINPKYEDDFIQGKLYMNNLKYYMDLEKQKGIKGVGDFLEASAVFADVDFTIKNPDTDEVLVEGKAGRVNLHSNQRILSPSLCMYSVDKDVLKFESEDEKYIKAVPAISERELEKLISDFGDNMLIINANSFIRRVIKKCEEDGIMYRMGKVNYYDFSVNYSDRISNYTDVESSDICFVKDNYFSSQNEYRILLENVYSEAAYTLEIGNIADLITKFKISDFFSGKFGVSFKKSYANPLE